GSALIIISYLTLPLMVTINFFAILLMVIILTMGEILYMPFTNTYVAKHAPASRRGEYLGLLSSSYSFAFVITPLVGFGVAEHYGYGVATYVCCGLALVGWGILSRVNILRQRKEGTAVSVQ
ncbi:MAG: MFS transporter, partial [Lewinella sp.]